MLGFDFLTMVLQQVNPITGSTVLLQWFQLAVAIVTLAGLAFSAMKIFNRNSDEWRDRERRLVGMEDEVKEMRTENRQILAFGSQLSELKNEMERVRDRMDQFLDSTHIDRSRVHNLDGNI
jgi:hypothetical protein